MAVHVTPETAKRLNDLATTSGRAPEEIVEAFRATLDLFWTGVDVMRQNLRRRHPEASNEEIERCLAEWLREPGAKAGDCLGCSVDVNTRLA